MLASLMSALPDKGYASFYRSSDDAEIYLILELPKGLGIWAIEIKCDLAVCPNRGLYHAIQVIKSARCFIVYAGKEHYKIAKDLEFIGLEALCDMLQHMIDD